MKKKKMNLKQEFISFIKDEWKFLLFCVVFTSVLLFPVDYYITTGGGIININFQKNNNIKKLSRITNLKIINKQSKINNKIKEIQIKKIFYTQKTQKKLIILFFILITIELIDYRRYLP